MPKIVGEKEGKRSLVFDPSDADDMKMANKMAQQQLEELEGKGDGLKSKEQFSKEAEIEAKLSKAEEGAKLFDELKSKIETDYAEKGLRMPNITDNATMEDAMQNLKEIEKLKQNQKEITGSAPLEGNIRASEGYKEGYNSTEELVEDLRTRSRLGDKESEKILGVLLRKAVQGVKSGKQGFGEIKTPEDGETELERLRRIQREKMAKLAEGRGNTRR